jgi:hypothetical protein
VKRPERDTEEVKGKAQDLEALSSNRLFVNRSGFFSPGLEMHVPVNIGLYCDKETAEKSRRRVEAVTGEPPTGQGWGAPTLTLS